MRFKQTDGFTLVELLITIVIASIVTLAATTVLLLGIRLNASSSKTAESQNTARIFMNVMDKLASSGSIDYVKSDSTGWEVLEVKKEGESETKKTLLSYDPEKQIIYTGTTPMIEEVMFSSIYLDGNVLTVGIETEEGAYTSSIYCRSIPDSDTSEAEKIRQEIVDNLTPVSGTTNSARAAFLTVLLTQRGSTGMILTDKGVKTPVYYSYWYNNNSYPSGWSNDTPWCACFVSWALKHKDVKDYVIKPESVLGNYYASVGGFKALFEEKDTNGEYLNTDEDDKPIKKHKWTYYEWSKTTYSIAQPGDLIFFDWDPQKEEAYFVEPDHIGVILMVVDQEGTESDYVYTIEGNTANMVAIRRYKLDSEMNNNQIMGFGVIDWKEDQIQPNNGQS